MFAAWVIKAVDVFEEGDFDLSAGLPVSAPDQFGLQRLEEAFNGRVVVAIALAAHRNLNSVLAQQFLVIVGTVLRSAIRVMNAAWWWPSDRDRHVQGSQGESLLHAIADRPTDDAPGEKVNDHSQINPPLPRPDIGDVACPLLVRPPRIEVLPQEIGRDVEPVVTVGGSLELPATDDLDTVLAHQTAHPALADTDAQLVQLLGHPWPAIAAQAQPVLIADMGEEHPVTPLAMRRGPVLPGMKPTLRNAHQAAQMAAGQHTTILGNILKLHGF